MRHLHRWAIILLLFTLAGCNLSFQPQAEPTIPPTAGPGTLPQVVITAPNDGSEHTVGTQIFVTANATDSAGVTRVQLLANNQIVKTISSEAATGQTRFEVLLDYTPRQEGDVVLQVVAFRGATASEPAEITIKVRATQAQVTATSAPVVNPPVIDPNDPTCRALTNTALNFRIGPGTVYDRISTLPPGTVVPIVGRLGDNSWWQVRVGTRVGWVSKQFTTEYGICAAVPVVPAPPTPTPIGFQTPVPPTATTPPPVATATPGKPDLHVTLISGSTTVSQGTAPNQSYGVNIKNEGTGPSGAFTVRVTLPDAAGTIQTSSVGSIDPGGIFNFTVTVNFAVADVGNRLLTIQLDSDNQVEESDEFNNISTLPITVNP